MTFVKTCVGSCVYRSCVHAQALPFKDQLIKVESLCVGRLHYGHLAPCQLGVQALDHGTAASNSWEHV